MDVKKIGRRLFLVLLCPVLLSGTAIAAEDEYTAYVQGLDRSCESDGDCTVKDIHNCCGYYPECVNVNARTDAGWVDAYCMRGQMDSVCGFTDIAACHCDHGKCVPAVNVVSDGESAPDTGNNK